MNLNVHDAAELLKVSEKTIYRWVRQGSLPAYRLRNQYRFNRLELLDWATSHRIEISPAYSLEPESREITVPPLPECLEAGGIYYRIEGTSLDAVLRSVAQTIRVSEGIDRDLLYRLLKAREELCSTAVGGGIALPHARNPMIPQVLNPSISLFFLENPVDFKAPDGKPVHILFALLSPTVRAHLYMLSSLTFALHDAGFRRILKQTGSREAIMKKIRQLSSSGGDEKK